MHKSTDLHGSMAQKSVLLIGGCHGTCLLRHSDDEGGTTDRRQFLLANGIVLSVCMAIIALIVALVWT
jgi:hypothetical protein